MNDYNEINNMLAGLSIREKANDNNSNKEEDSNNFNETRKNVENVFMRDLNFFQKQGNKSVIDRIERDVDMRMNEGNLGQQFPDANKLLSERGFTPTSSVFPGNRNNSINVVREDMPLSTRVISKKKQYEN